MARPKRQANTPATRERILAAARIEFAEQGMTASLEAIAARCGIRRPSLLHHFPSKQALVTAVIDELLDKARTRLTQTLAAGHGDYASTMRAIIGVMRTLEYEEAGIGSVLLRAMMSSDSGETVSKRVAGLVEVIYATALMAGAAEKRPADEIRAAIAHLVMGEMARLAMGEHADELWGDKDGVDPLFAAYFL